MHNYVYKKTAFVQGGVKAQDAGEELARIHKRHGQLTPSLVVDESRSQEATLHRIFEWDDEIAAENFRHHQARALIKSIEIEKPEGETEPVYVHVQTAKAYLPIKTVVQNQDLFDSTCRAAEKRLKEAAYSLNQLKALARKHNEGMVDEALDFVAQAQKSLEKNDS